MLSMSTLDSYVEDSLYLRNYDFSDSEYSNSSDEYCSGEDCFCGDERIYTFYWLKQEQSIELWCLRDEIPISHALISDYTIFVTNIGSRKKPFTVSYDGKEVTTKVYRTNTIATVTSIYYSFYSPIIEENENITVLSIPECQGTLIPDINSIAIQYGIKWLLRALRGRRQ